MSASAVVCDLAVWGNSSTLPLPWWLAVARHDVGEGGVGGFELDTAQALVQLLDREIAIDDGDNNVVVPGLDCPVDYQDVAVKDAGFAHGVAPSAQQEGGLRVFDQRGAKVNALCAQVLGRGGEAREHRAQEVAHVDRGPIDREDAVLVELSLNTGHKHSITSQQGRCTDPCSGCDP